jgi:hypothetical protein
LKKNTKDGIVCNFKNYLKKLGQAAGEIFRVAGWTRSELVVSRGGWVGQADAEKLAQRSPVAVGQALEYKTSKTVLAPHVGVVSYQVICKT